MPSQYTVIGSGCAIPDTTTQISGEPRVSFHYKATFGSHELTKLTITKSTETDMAWAGRLQELRGLVDAINACKNATAHAAMLVRLGDLD